MKTKTLLASKTFWTGIATICTGLGLFFSGEKELEELIMSIVGVVFIYLRIITNLQIKGIK